MQFKKGDPRINRKGRPKGSRNKATEKTRAAIDKVIAAMNKDISGVLKELKKSSPKEFARVYCNLIEFQLPKQSRTEHVGLSVEDLLKMPRDEQLLVLREYKERQN